MYCNVGHRGKEVGLVAYPKVKKWELSSYQGLGGEKFY